MAIYATLLIVSALAILSLNASKIRRTLQSWKFLIKGRQILLDMAQNVGSILHIAVVKTNLTTLQNPHKAFSVPIPGTRLHVMSTKEHWADFNRASQTQLSPMAASREMFQPKYTFGFDWKIQREHVSLITVRSLRATTALLETFRPKLISMLEEEFRKAIGSRGKDGWSRIPLWETTQRATTRMNTLVILGEELG